MKRVLLCFTVLIGALFPASAQVEFGGLQLRESGDLLFSALAQGPGEILQRTVLYADIQTREIDQLTFFPERVDTFGPQHALIIQNRMGSFIEAARYPAVDGARGWYGPLARRADVYRR